MEYQVPQFIEAEDKIVGPLTFKQFLYLGGGTGLAVVCFITLPFLFAALLATPIMALAIALSFYKINGKPFIEVLEAWFNYLVGAKLFLWKREEGRHKREQTAAAIAAAEATAAQVARASRSTPKLTSGKLSELAWSLDVKAPEQTPRS